jgi:hypothetical protein
MKDKREIDVNDVRKLVGKLLTVVEATVPAGNQKAAKQLVTQTIWQVFDVVGDWKVDDEEILTGTNTGIPVKL